MAENIYNEMIKEFQAESSVLIKQMINILENCEGDFSQVLSLEGYGQLADSIMGGAKTISAQVKGNPLIAQLGDYAVLCKAVGYKASQIENNEDFYNVAVAFLIDATAVLEKIIDNIVDRPNANLKDFVSQTLIDRLKWVSNQFGANYRASFVSNKSADNANADEAGKMSANDISALMKKLGIH